MSSGEGTKKRERAESEGGQASEQSPGKRDRGEDFVASISPALEFPQTELLALRDKWEKILERLGGPPDGSENGLDEETLVELLLFLKKQWTQPLGPKDERVLAAAARLRLRDRFESGSLASKDIDVAYRRELFKWTRLQTAFLARGLLRAGGGAASAKGQERIHVEDLGSSGYSSDFRRIADIMARSRDVLRADIALARELDPSIDAACPTEVDPFGYMPVDFASLSTLQELTLFLLRNLALRGLRRYNDACYKQILSPPVDCGEGEVRRYPTHAWERVCDIKEFVQDVASKEDQFAQWKNMLNGNNLSSVVSYLMGCNEIEFQPLHPDRHWHAFHNGLYNTSRGVFFPWGVVGAPAGVVACNYHDTTFDVEILKAPHWYDVPTHDFHSILETQLGAGKRRDGETEDDYAVRAADAESIIMWQYTFMGRLLFELGEHDSWQVIPFICGKAGTGKSTILKAAGWFFRDEDVETLANNSQKGFGLETFLGKLMWRCMEVKNDLSLDQAQLQSMVSGECISIQRKHKTALSVTWKIPGILAGNEVAKWADNSGSISRRIIITFFERKIEEGKKDPHLEKKIRTEIGNLLHKCCLAYLGATEAYGHKDIWDTYEDPDLGTTPILPLYYHNNKKKLQSQTHPLVAFLTGCDDIVLIDDKRSGMPFDRFKELALAWMDKNGFGKFAFRADAYASIFDTYKLSLLKLTSAHLHDPSGQFVYRGEAAGVNKLWLFGVVESSEMVDG